MGVFLIPFDGIFIDCINPDLENLIEEVKEKFQRGLIDEKSVHNLLHKLVQQGSIQIEDTTLISKAGHVTGARPRFNKDSKEKWNQKKNPLSGKGESYAERVNGPNGWGEYVQPEGDTPF